MTWNHIISLEIRTKIDAPLLGKIVVKINRTINLFNVESDVECLSWQFVITYIIVVFTCCEIQASIEFVVKGMIPNG